VEEDQVDLEAEIETVEMEGFQEIETIFHVILAHLKCIRHHVRHVEIWQKYRLSQQVISRYFAQTVLVLSEMADEVPTVEIMGGVAGIVERVVLSIDQALLINQKIFERFKIKLKHFM
jgi:hypothetical protein